MSVVYRVQEHDWWLWWRCGVCGGATLPLQHGGSLNRMRREGIIGSRVPGCPRCETQRRRLMTPDARPAVWYDTGMRDWVVQLPAAGPEESVVLPLGFGWFDSPWPEIYRAAADLVYAGDMFEEAPI